MDKKPGMFACWKEAAIVAGRILLAYAVVIACAMALIGVWQLAERFYR